MSLVRVQPQEPFSQVALARGKRKNFGASFQVHRFGLREELGRGPGNVGGAWKFSQRFQWRDGVRGKPANSVGGAVQFR